MGIEEDTPGIGFWIAVALGLLAGGLTMAWLDVGWIVAVVVAVVVGGLLMLLLS